MIPDVRPVVAMLATATLLLFANMSVEPIITVYVGQLIPAGGNVVLTAGLVMAASAMGSILAAPRLGRLADRIGPWRVIVGCLSACALLLIPQAFVTAAWQLIGLRFLMGIALAGLLPAITATIRHSVPQAAAGTILGYSTSAQYAGQVPGAAGRRLRGRSDRDAGGVPGHDGDHGGGRAAQLEARSGGRHGTHEPGCVGHRDACRFAGWRSTIPFCAGATRVRLPRNERTRRTRPPRSPCRRGRTRRRPHRRRRVSPA